MPNVIEIHLVDGEKIQTTASSLGDLQNHLTGPDPWRVVENRKHQQVAVRLDKVSHLIVVGETRG